MMSQPRKCNCGECSLCKQRVTNREYIERNKEKVREAGRLRYQANREELRAKARVKYAENREKIRAKARADYQSNPEKHRAAARIWNAQNAEKKAAGRLKRTYGLTPEDITKCLEHQGGKCDLCPRLFSKTVQPCVDHCHKTGQVRSLLCSRCNLLLGRIENNRGRIPAFLDYIDRWTVSDTEAAE